MKSTTEHLSLQRKTAFVFGLLVVLAGSLLAASPAQDALAQAPTPTDDEVNRIAHQLYCPVCENTPLDVCPTEACRQWRDLIRTQLSEGKTEQEIQAYFVEQYGARVLAEPPRAGLNWLIYVLPPLLIIVGIIMLVRSMRAWTAPAGAGSSPGGPGTGEKSPSNEYMARLEDELKKRS